MKKKAIFFSTLLTIGFMLCFTSPSFGQNALPLDQVIPTNTQVPDRKKSMLSTNELIAKDLYEQAYSTTLTETQFRQKCASSQPNLLEWQTVLSTLANANIDLTCVQNIITTMNQKLNN